jgi:hypothetical protein
MLYIEFYKFFIFIFIFNSKQSTFVICDYYIEIINFYKTMILRIRNQKFKFL